MLTHLKFMFFLLFKEGTEYFSASPRLSGKVKRLLFKIQF